MVSTVKCTGFMESLTVVTDDGFPSIMSADVDAWCIQKSWWKVVWMLVLL